MRDAVALALALVLVGGGCGPSTRGVRLYEFGEPDLAVGVVAVGTAKVHQSRGRLYVEARAAGDGVFLEVPAAYDCVALEDVVLDAPLPRGGSVTFTWFAIAADGTVFPLLVSEWVEVGSTEYTTTKNDASGRPVQRRVVVSDETIARYQPFRVAFDRRTVGGVEQIQLEFRDPSNNTIKKLFPWADPAPTRSFGLQITTDLTGFSIGAVDANPVHEPTRLPEFSPSEFRDVPDEQPDEQPVERGGM